MGQHPTDKRTLKESVLLGLFQGFFLMNLPGRVRRVSAWVLSIMTVNVNLVPPPALTVVERPDRIFFVDYPAANPCQVPGQPASTRWT